MSSQITLNNGLSSKDALSGLAIEPFDEFKADFESIKKIIM